MRNDWGQQVKEVLIGIMVTIGLLIAVYFGMHMIQTVHDSDTQVEIEKEHTEQQRLDSCNHVEDQAVRVLCLNGAGTP